MSFFQNFFRPKSRLFVKRNFSAFPKEKKARSPLKRILLLVFFIGLSFSVVFAAYIGIVIANTPSLQNIETLNFAQSSVIYDRTGTKALYTLYGEENRKNVSFSEIAEPMKKAILAAEDADFYNHPGVDLMAILRSGYYAVRYRETRGGGSTITQQLIKNVQFAGGEKTFRQRFERKIQEAIMSWRLEKTYNKDHILGLYLNRVPFGKNAYGVESAARIYFGKSAKDLSLAESAFLAGLPQSPGVFSRRTNVEFTLPMNSIEQFGIETYEDAKRLAPDSITKGVLGSQIPLANGRSDFFPGRFDYVLGQMLEKKFITQQEFDAANQESKSLKTAEVKVNIFAPHFVDYVRDILGKQYDESFLERGGLRIITTLDVDMQNSAEAALKEVADKNSARFDSHNAALVAIDPRNGQVLAHVGSRDYFATELDGEKFDGQYDVITQFPGRQPGSTFKPIAYATAFDQKGLAPATVLFDVQTDFGAGYIPKNFSGTFSGPITIRKALGNSLNIPAIKAGIIAGVENVKEVAVKMGITLPNSADWYGSPLFIGSAEIRPIEMAQAYAAFANKGRKISANPILKIIDEDGNVLQDFTKLEEPKPEDQIVSEDTAYLISNILADPEARGIGWNATLSLPDGRPAAVKTGTSDKIVNGKKFASDGWTIGYTPQILTVVWTGNNDGTALAPSASGFGSVTPIWQKFMIEAHKNLPKESFEIPEGIRHVKVAKYSGKIPQEGTDEKLIVDDIFSSKWLPQEVDDSIKLVEVEKITKKLPNEFTPPDAIEKFVVLNFHSYFSDRTNWERPVESWAREKGPELAKTLGVENLIASAPTEVTTKYTAETQANAPEMRILSPANYGIVSPPFINVDVSGEAKNGMEKMEFYWDDTLVSSLTTAPWTVKMDVGSAQNGSTHKIRVDALDRLLYRNSSEIEVKIGEDTVPPELQILSPTDGQTVEAGSTLVVSASSLDRNSAVKRVSFEINGQGIGGTTKIPFEVVWKVPSEEKQYTLTALSEDSSGNKTTGQVTFSVKKSLSSAKNTFGILTPANNSHVSGNVTITAFVPPEFRNTTVGIIAKNQDGKKEDIATFDSSEIPENGILSVVWRNALAGNYDLYISTKGARSDFSPKVSVVRE